MTDNPFGHHPGLAPLITPYEDSVFAGFRVEKAVAMMREHGVSADWVQPEAEREACRARALAGRRDNDLWVFAYGSLMWDPGMRFAEVRRAFAPEVERRFILYDTRGARGTIQSPGVMAALDHGAGCHGLAFRITAAHLEEDTYSLWCRERIGAAYLPAFIAAQTDHGEITALTFLADHDAESIRAGLSHEDQVRAVARGAGFLGSSFDYLANLARHFEELRIEDQGVRQLLADATVLRR